MKDFDNKYLSNEIKLVAGVDEAGRGPLAGPVVAAAVIFDPETTIEFVNDSKKLVENKREELFEIIKSGALSYGVAIVDESEIDRINILQASLKAMKIAVEKLSPAPDIILIDGNKSFASVIPTRTIVKGDSKSFSIAASSILAKVTRDRLMREISSDYPEYVWHKNKGYGTKEHIEAIKVHGATRIHRRTFLGNILSEEQLDLVFNK